MFKFFSRTWRQDAVKHENKQALKGVEDTKQVLENSFGVVDCQHSKEPG